MLKHFLTVIIPAVIVFAAGAGEVKVDFSDKQVPLDLKNGAVIKNNILEFEKKRSFAEVPGTLDMDFSNGGTLMMTVREGRSLGPVSPLTLMALKLKLIKLLPRMIT